MVNNRCYNSTTLDRTEESLKLKELSPTSLERTAKGLDITAEAFRVRPITGQFLWNAKPRVGKTLTTYDLAKRVGAKNVLILTGRPAIANSWYEDYEKFLGTESGYVFVSEVSALKTKSMFDPDLIIYMICKQIQISNVSSLFLYKTSKVPDTGVDNSTKSGRISMIKSSP